VSEPSGVRVWVPATAPIALWLVHLVALSALTRSACADGTNWVAHVLTAALGALTALAIVACELLRRRGARLAAEATDDGAAEVPRNLEFIGIFGMLLGAFSLALILYEGSWAITVPACHA
jgi:hypothetical protein